MATLRDSLRAILPPFLRGVVGDKFTYVSGLILDVMTEWFWEGVRVRFPGEHPEAFAALGRDRLIVRGFAEPGAAFAVRLRRFLDDHRIRGNALSIFRQLRGYMTPHTPVMRYVVRANAPETAWISFDAAGVLSFLLATANWNWDGLLAQWSRFWLIVYPPAGLWTAGPNIGDDALWGGAIGTEGYTIGSTATPEQVSAVRSIASEWKAGGSKCVELILAWDSNDFEPTDAAPPNPDGNWANFGKNVAGVEVPARITNAAYWPVD